MWTELNVNVIWLLAFAAINLNKSIAINLFDVVLVLNFAPRANECEVH
jgi:hypothetical protein